jgi:hypothetical protein
MYRSIRKIDENRLEVVVGEANDSMISLATAENCKSRRTTSHDLQTKDVCSEYRD